MDDVTSNVKGVMIDLLEAFDDRKFYYEISSLRDFAYIYTLDIEITVEEINTVNKIVNANGMCVDYILFNTNHCGDAQINFVVTLNNNL